jgi:hypothetical protein
MSIFANVMLACIVWFLALIGYQLMCLNSILEKREK